MTIGGLLHTPEGTFSPVIQTLCFLLQRIILFTELGIFNLLFGIAMIDIQSQRQQKIFDDIFLSCPATTIQRHQGNRVGYLPGADNGYQPGSHRSRWCRLRLPVIIGERAFG